jgi:hypothetical protein
MRYYAIPSSLVNESVPDYVGFDDLLAMGFDPAQATDILRHSPLSGNGQQPLVEFARLAELLDGRGA